MKRLMFLVLVSILVAGLLALGGSDDKFVNSRGSLFLNIDADNNDNNELLRIASHTTGAVGGTTFITVLENGNVGIGTSAPNCKLDVLGQAEFTGDVLIGSAQGGAGKLRVGEVIEIGDPPFNSSAALNVAGGNVFFDEDLDIDLDLNVDGNVTIQSTITVGQFISPGYNHFGSGGTPTSGDITNNGDVFVRNDLEVSGTFYGVASIQSLNSSGANRAWLTETTSDAGFIQTFGPNGLSNARISHLIGFPNNGFISVQDEFGDSQIRLFVNSAGQGQIVKDVSNFRMANPDDPETEIWYACLEGPEAGAYFRGTGQLIAGRSVITLPEHFRAVASPKGMTVQLTPLSASSKGLAVVEKSLERLVVQELGEGMGTYEFDFLIMAIRGGYEDYQVIRPVINLEAPPIPTAQDDD